MVAGAGASVETHIPAEAPPDLFITDALDRRSSPRPDFDADAHAIQALAVGMGDHPELALSQFVDFALKVTGAISGGISLFEPSPPPGVFRWHFLRGALSPFNGATTPRDFSPCGFTLDRNEPVLTRRPERVYTWLADAQIELPEVLLVPLRGSGGEPFGALWVVADTEGLFTRDHATLLSDVAVSVGGIAARWGSEPGV